MNAGARLAVDIGGTFTDVVLEHDGGQERLKLLTTPAAPESAVLEGIDTILQRSGVKASDVTLVIHGTTLATNALIERKGAHTALITTDGFRDSIEIAYEHRFEQYDLYMERPQPLIARDWRFSVPERIAADGSVLLELDEAALRDLADKLAKTDIEAVAVCFLHSYVNPDHELRAGEILAELLPNVSITLSAEVCPEIREYDRMSTACANAYVQPMMAGYLNRLQGGLQSGGITCPLLLMMSSGGVTTVETAVRLPIRLVESGPAGGAILAREIAKENDLRKALSFDMGGTTAKITLIDDFQPQIGRSFEVARMSRFLKGSGLPLRIPAIEMVEIGAGGGSIAEVDAMRRIHVGPESAGSVPGPACYGNGGTAATVTDADTVLGRIDPSRFAGGQVTLEPDRAAAAVSKDIGDALEVETNVAAAGVSEIVDEHMANAARVHAVENGKNMIDRSLVAFGGAAPLHAARLADKLGINTVIVPQGAGVGSAIGFLRAQISYEVVRTRYTDLREFDADTVNDIFGSMRAEAEAVVRLGAPDEALVETRGAFMRYRGQGHEIMVPLPVRDLGAGDGEALADWFAEAYEALFMRTIPNLGVEVLTWTLSLATGRPSVEAAPQQAADGSLKSVAQRELFDPASGAWVEAEVYAREDMGAGATVPGPAMIVEDGTTTLVTNGFGATINALGQIVMTRASTSTGEG
ncbi:MAG: hydantoinase/oxoprolinase family protein [Rhodospirillaceae bacterium]|mgnify:FL=1|jgi:N-methylhydantoinase A|nr:hydantoinase/oxoprolinase family protein [Rhodospirillaceae bacterium]MBT3491407.1 hydantoinase/oxoprolinase family protein [Rhodospirillaceae bacterium]MBT3782589.1 hydantoinase/oxoprolinase family protein [Rhodospirillaceae bacterium]MBT3974938.1 hydantoinase/oxoprolinase family protein [Rhodospirillaceae bacterium]MBT4167866.1 hydantoinase/oxoprolinase family protein [Rhodospirillaceae bacterium]